MSVRAALRPGRVAGKHALEARAVGLVGHLLEESRDALAQELWLRTEAEATERLRPKQ